MSGNIGRTHADECLICPCHARVSASSRSMHTWPTCGRLHSYTEHVEHVYGHLDTTLEISMFIPDSTLHPIVWHLGWTWKCPAAGDAAWQFAECYIWYHSCCPRIHLASRFVGFIDGAKHGMWITQHVRYTSVSGNCGLISSWLFTWVQDLLQCHQVINCFTAVWLIHTYSRTCLNVHLL